MWNVARFSIERPLYSWLLILACLVSGVVGLDRVGRLEDPPFPLSRALVLTEYPGASAYEVEQEVTDPIEAALQELPYVDELRSKSMPGHSEIHVEIMDRFSADEIPQIYDELRRRVSEAAGRLPPGAGAPLVEDDYTDVYGILYAVAAPDYGAGEIQDMSRQISTALKAVPGVAKVQIAGAPQEAIYVELDRVRMGRLGLPVDALFNAIAVENQVTPAGSVAFAGRRLRIAPQLAFASAAAVGDMRIGRPGSTEIVRLGDIANISRALVEAPSQIIRHNGAEVFTLGVSVTEGENVVHVGRAVEAAMGNLLGELPLGVTTDLVYAQHAVVDEAVQQFFRNLGLSVATVGLALCLFMGWRAGAMVGAVLLLTMLGTLGLMALLGIELQRISLGALMIAMGMLVDNGIVVAEGMLMGVRRGLTPAEAAAGCVRRTQFPLLGATIIGAAAFGPISLADDAAGHFLRSLFQVVAIALLLSWVLAVTVVPLLGSRLLRPGAQQTEQALYAGWGYAPYRRLLGFGLQRAWLTTFVILAVLGACLWGAQFVKQSFFPTTNAPLYYVDYRLAEGADILATAADVQALEQALLRQPGVVAVTSFIGQGAPRFTATMQPEQPNPAYAQLVVRVQDVRALAALMAAGRELLQGLRPDAEVHVTRAEFTPGSKAKIEARFSGPDAQVLRTLADDALRIYMAHDLVDRKTDWRQPALQLRPRFDEARARLAGVSRTDVSQSLAYATYGVPIGLYREGHKLVPIIARAPAAERKDVASLGDRLVWSPAERRFIPMRQVVSAFDLVAEDNLVFRFNRVRTIQAQANPQPGRNAGEAFAKVRPAVQAIPLPPGYRLAWGGEYESNLDAYQSVAANIPLALGIMFLITVLMFGRLREALVIWLSVPMIVCGVVVGLLITDLSFTYPSFLGFLSLSGMLIKNCIVLVDEIDKRLKDGAASFDALLQGSISRLRPVMLAAGTTIAGMSPLLADPFFREMAVCIMSGLAFATLLTLVAVPVFYRIALGNLWTSPGSPEEPKGRDGKARRSRVAGTTQ